MTQVDPPQAPPEQIGETAPHTLPQVPQLFASVDVLTQELPQRFGVEPVHVDFKRVDVNERIHVSVPVELRGIAPGVTGGGVLEQPMHALHVECLAISIPQSIRVNIGELQLDGSIYVRELHLPEGVTALDDPDAIVIHVKQPQVEVEAAPAPEAAAETAEPEVIGRKAAEEEAEAE